jgi:2-iminobutanoate/2-iminopropanoate deaminase
MGALVQVEDIGDGGGMEISSTRHRISSEPDWYERYAISLGIRVGDLVFVSGQAAVDEHGQTVGGDDFDAQARQVFANLATVLGNAGTGLEHVVKVTIFVTDMAVIDRVVQLRREFFTPPYPADTIAQVASLADPAWQIEIEAIAVVPR